MELEINNQKYRIGKLNALQQFHITRRLMPALAAVGLSYASLKDAANGGGTGSIMEAVEKASEVLAKMSDEDSNYVIFTCLGAVTRLSGSGYAKISQGQALAFEDIDMMAMIRLVVEVVRLNLQGFFAGLGDGTQLPSS